MEPCGFNPHPVAAFLSRGVDFLLWGQGRPWRGKRTLSEGPLPPPNLPHLPELPCTATAAERAKLFPFFGRRLPCREVFGRIGRCVAAKSAASRLIGGRKVWKSVSLAWWRFSPSSVANAPNCLQFSSPRGEAFCTLFEHGKYGFESCGVLTVRPHPSPTAPPSPSKGKAFGSTAYFKKSASTI